MRSKGNSYTSVQLILILPWSLFFLFVCIFLSFMYFFSLIKKPTLICLMLSATSPFPTWDMYMLDLRTEKHVRKHNYSLNMIKILTQRQKPSSAFFKIYWSFKTHFFTKWSFVYVKLTYPPKNMLFYNQTLIVYCLHFI